MLLALILVFQEDISYILMSICYFSHFLRPIHFKNDKQSVAFEMVDILSHSGLPTAILIDQCSVFVSKSA